MNLRVFLVEDSAVIRHNLTAALEELAPVEVVGFAEDEAAAANWIRAHGDACDLVVIDIFLKRGSGLGFLRQTATLTKASKVILSNYATPEMRKTCLQLGAREVFDKSTEIEMLVDYCVRLETDITGA